MYREQEVITNVAPQATVLFDRSLLADVLQALLKNAMYYSPARTKIWIDAVESGERVQISIRDEGFGISSEDLNGIFHEMRRGTDAMRQRPVGNGLGLYITKGILERGGGDMWIDSQKGKGTTVTITLPTAK